MKYLFSTVISCCLILVASFAYAGEQSWSFEADAADWAPANGAWSVEDGTYKLAKGGRAEHSLIGEVGWEDYTVEAKVRLMRETGQALFFAPKVRWSTMSTISTSRITRRSCGDIRRVRGTP